MSDIILLFSIPLAVFALGVIYCVIDGHFYKKRMDKCFKDLANKPSKYTELKGFNE